MRFECHLSRVFLRCKVYRKDKTYLKAAQLVCKTSVLPILVLTFKRKNMNQFKHQVMSFFYWM